MFRSPARATLLLGLSVYTVLAILATVFYLERTVFIDVAFHVVTILKKKTLFIQNQRFVALFSQIFPLAAERLHLSLKGVLLAYSLGFIVYYGAIFAACTAWLRQWQMGLVMLLLSTLLVTDTFYWVQSELPQGLALLVFTFALLLRGRTPEGLTGWQLGLLFGLWFTVVFAHPMLVFPVLFLLLFFVERNTGAARIHPKLLIGSGVFVVLMLLIKNKVFGPAGYDAGAMGRADNLRKLFPHFFDLQSNRDLLYWCLGDYFLLPLTFLAAVVFYFWQKKWYKLLIISSFFLGYLLLVNVSFASGDNRFYLENLYLPLVLFVAVPLAFDLLPYYLAQRQASPVRIKWAFGMLAILLGIRLWQIGLAHQPWTARLDWERQLLATTAALPQPKIILPESQVPMDKLVMSWGSSFEFMLLSSLENPDQTRLITIDEDPAHLQWATDQRRAIITEWEVWKYDDLPKRYFHPQDTSLYDLRK